MPPSTEQEKFRQSQTWYRPHGTETHRVSLSVVPFPKRTLIFNYSRIGFSNQASSLNPFEVLNINSFRSTALLICLLTDGNSIFQVSLFSLRSIIIIIVLANVDR